MKTSDFSGEQFHIFNEFRKLYPGIKRGNETEFLAFKQKHKDWKELLPKLSGWLQTQIAQRSKKISNNEWVPQWQNFKTYIYQRSWEIGTEDEEIKTPQKTVFTPEQKHQQILDIRRRQNEQAKLENRDLPFKKEELNEPFKGNATANATA